jgi:hypothetical protein
MPAGELMKQLVGEVDERFKEMIQSRYACR